MQLCTVFVMLLVNSKFPNRITTAITNIAVIHDQKREKEEIALYCLLVVRYCTKNVNKRNRLHCTVGWILHQQTPSAPTDSQTPSSPTDSFCTNRLHLFLYLQIKHAQPLPKSTICSSYTASLYATLLHSMAFPTSKSVSSGVNFNNPCPPCKHYGGPRMRSK